MKVVFRAVAVSVMLSLAWAGPLAPFAAAQQPPPPGAPAPAEPPPAVPAPAPAGAPPQMVQEDVKPAPQPAGVDAYDVGAAAATALSLPLKAGICVFGFSVSVALIAGTFGSRPDAAAWVLDEACGSKAKWIVRGSDLRPKPEPSKAFEWEQHRFDWER